MVSQTKEQGLNMSSAANLGWCCNGQYYILSLKNAYFVITLVYFCPLLNKASACVNETVCMFRPLMFASGKCNRDMLAL